MMSYEGTAEELVRRIQALIPAHPEILFMETPFDLFRIPGFSAQGLSVSLAQVTWALQMAQRIPSSNDSRSTP